MRPFLLSGEMMEMSLADELRGHLQEAETTETEVVTVPVETGTEETLDSTARDEQGRFAKTEEQAAETKEQAVEQVIKEEAQATDQTVQDAANSMRPPATWSAAAKAEFAKLPETVRNEIAKREADFSRGVQKYAEKATLAEKYLNEFQPYEHMFRSLGATHEQFLRDSLATEYRLRTISPQEKTQMLMQYAKHYGADLSIIPQMLGLQAGGENQQTDIQALVEQRVQQLLSPIAQKVQSWERQSETASQRQAQELEHEIEGQIAAFQSATDESGQPKHIFYENVRADMAALIGAGRAKSLDQAYEMACYANPEVRTALIAQEQSKQESKRLEEAKRKADEAKRASFSVEGQGGVGIADTSKLSLADELRSHLQGSSRV